MNQPPNDLGAERSLLAAVLNASQEPESQIAAAMVSQDVFYDPKHAEIWRAIDGLREKNDPVDLVTVHKALGDSGGLGKAGGAVYLSELTDAFSTASNAEHYARILLDRRSGRRLAELTREYLGKALSPHKSSTELVLAAAKEVSALTTEAMTKEPRSMAVLVKREFKRIEAAHEKGDLTPGMSTGFTDLDNATSGLHPGNLVVLAGRPGMGKSALAQALASNVASAGHPVLMFSLEMSDEEIARRGISCEAGIDATRQLSGNLQETDWPRLAKALGTLAESKLWVEDTPAITIDQVAAIALAQKYRHGLGLIVVDYLQLMRGRRRRDESREREIAEISSGLKALAKELQVPIIALSQLNRGLEQRQDKRPMLSDLRESGAIEQDADVVLFIYRDDYYNDATQSPGIAEVIVAKQRMGQAPVTIELVWQAKYTRFLNKQHGGR